MRGPTRNLTISILVVAALVAFVPTILALSNCLGLRGEIRDWFVPVDAESLVRFSDRIVVVRFLGETLHGTPNSTRTHAEARVAFVDVYRGFEVVQSLKGGFEPGDTAYVRWSDGYYRRGADGKPEFIERPGIALMPGEPRVLFLTRYHGPRPPDLAPEVRVWIARRGVGVARMDSDGRLTFETSANYRAALKDMGLKPLPDSGAPFELTLDDIRTMVASAPPGTQ